MNMYYYVFTTYYSKKNKICKNNTRFVVKKLKLSCQTYFCSLLWYVGQLTMAFLPNLTLSVQMYNHLCFFTLFFFQDTQVVDLP